MLSFLMGKVDGVEIFFCMDGVWMFLWILFVGVFFVGGLR